MKHYFVLFNQFSLNTFQKFLQFLSSCFFAFYNFVFIRTLFLLSFRQLQQDVVIIVFNFSMCIFLIGHFFMLYFICIGLVQQLPGNGRRPFGRPFKRPIRVFQMMACAKTCQNSSSCPSVDYMRRKFQSTSQQCKMCLARNCGKKIIVCFLRML